MTCVIATPLFMAADRRVTCDGASSSMVKVARNAFLIAAGAGTAKTVTSLKKAVKEGAQDPDELCPLVDSDSYALVLLPTGRIYRIQEKQIWTCPPGCVEGIGSGADLALGWIGGAYDGVPVSRIPIDGVRKALRFVSRRRSDCGGGVDVRYFRVSSVTGRPFDSVDE